MLVRAFRSRQRGRWIPVVALAFIAIVAARPGDLAGQQPTSPLPKTHTVKRGDTLWDISKLYLGDPYLWPEIYRINTDQIEDPHWIYPGEVLKLPGATATVIAVMPPAASPPPETVPEPTPLPYRPTTFASVPTVAPRQEPPPPPRTTVRTGEYAAAPWADQQGGPRGSGYIIEALDLPGTASADHSHMQLYDRVFISPPTGAVAPEHEIYLAYRLGPSIENFAQIVIPTGLIEITRAPRNGEAAIGRVTKKFGEMTQGQRLIAYDSTAAVVYGTAAPVMNGPAGKVRWMLNEPVLTTLQDYVVVDITKRDGITTGDRIEFYRARQKPTETRSLALPEVFIAYGQVLRVTPFGATAIIVTQEQPTVSDGTSARIAAKMP